MPATPSMAAPTPAIDTSEEVAQALARLADLRDRGAITPEEFETKKAELLSRL
jgi:predicted Zn-dependent peptidase